MIITEHYAVRRDGVVLERTYSDRGVYIRKAGTEEVYSEAIDPAGSGRVYEETDEMILVEREED